MFTDIFFLQQSATIYAIALNTRSQAPASRFQLFLLEKDSLPLDKTEARILRTFRAIKSKNLQVLYPLTLYTSLSRILKKKR